MVDPFVLYYYERIIQVIIRYTIIHTYIVWYIYTMYYIHIIYMYVYQQSRTNSMFLDSDKISMVRKWMLYISDEFHVLFLLYILPFIYRAEQGSKYKMYWVKTRKKRIGLSPSQHLCWFIPYVFQEMPKEWFLLFFLI